MSSLLSDYYYELPRELIAERPPEKRDQSRMLLIDRATQKITHTTFSEITNHLTSDDLVVLNNSKVIPARLFDQSGKVELLLISQKSPTTWISMVKPGRKMGVGATLLVGDRTLTVKSILADGTREIEFDAPIDLDRWGKMPIPPYFKRPAEELDRERYQTLFARHPGSVAAPTAGLHFTSEILAQLHHTFITLHVGPGTFLPVKEEDLSQHKMHREKYSIDEECARHLQEAVTHNKRIVAIGTTTTRVLESQPHHHFVPHKGSTDIFIRPPYQFQNVGGLLTNFHLPSSTLIMLVSSLLGREWTLEIYQEAIREKYRFFSYGDCMLIL